MGVGVVQMSTSQFSAVDERKQLSIGYRMVLYTLQVLTRGATSLSPPTSQL